MIYDYLINLHQYYTVNNSYNFFFFAVLLDSSPSWEGGSSSPGIENEVQPRDVHRRSEARERTRLLPLSNVHRIMRRVLPPDAKTSNECKELMVECAVDFISLITNEANHQCQLEHRRTITAEDLINAMDRLGFHNNVVLLTRFLQRYRMHNNNNVAVADVDARVGQAQHVNIPPQSTTIALNACDVVPMPMPVAPPPLPSPLPPPSPPYDPNQKTEMDRFFGDESSGIGGDDNSSNVDADPDFDPITYLNRDCFFDD